MKNLVTGDPHFLRNENTVDKFNPEILKNEFGNDLDIRVFILGDTNIHFSPQNEDKEHINRIIHKLDSFGYDIFFIDGNHDNVNNLIQYPKIKMFNKVVHKISKHIYYLPRGYVYEIDDLNVFVMGGATSVDKKNRILGVDYFECEIPSYKEMRMAFNNLQDKHWRVDYVLSHTCPTFLKNMIISNQNDRMLKECVLSNFFESLILDRKLSFERWLFGHFHMNKSFRLNDRSFSCLYGCYMELI